MQKYVNG